MMFNVAEIEPGFIFMVLIWLFSSFFSKKGKKKNRRSIIITLDTTTNTFKHELTLQDSNKPILKKIKPRFSIKILNYIYTLNHHVYKFVFNILFNSYFYFIAIKYPQIMYHLFVYKKPRKLIEKEQEYN